MRTNTDAASTRSEIERTYRERRSGFLAWARGHAPDFATAEDVLQEAFMKALANASALSIVEDMAGWIFAAMRNRLTDLWRGKAARRRAGATELPEKILEEIATAAGFDPYDELVRGELAGAIEAAIGALPAPQREVLLAQAVEGLTFRELAERTGASIDTLMARKRYAVKKLAAALIEWYDFE
ncbi:MAG: RNA polymerase sigma factor [Candidatus Aminicenantales bacterium]